MLSGVTMDYKTYIQSENWRKKRENVLIFWGYRCALCFSPNNLHVHHRTYERLGRELITDLIPLCERCHNDHHNFTGRSTNPETIAAVLDRFEVRHDCIV